MNIINELKYTVDVPEMRNKFMNIKKDFFKNYKESEDPTKEIRRSYQEYKVLEGEISQSAKELLYKLLFIREEDGAVYLKVKDTFTCDILLYVPRGINLECEKITLSVESKFEVANIFNIYGTEGFTIRIRTEDANIVIEPASSSGVKGISQVNVYSLENGVVIKGDASRYIDTNSILEDYRG